VTLAIPDSPLLFTILLTITFSDSGHESQGFL
jgi:hypothetical protein